MNKRITSIMLCFVLLVSMLATSVPAFALDNVNLKVTADKQTANPGDTINYEVSIGTVTLLGGLDFKLIVPTGLTIADSSITIPDNLETVLDSDGDIIIPTNQNGYRWSYSAQNTGYTGNSDLVVVEFACTVDNNCALDNKEVTIQILDLFDNEDLDDFPYTIVPAVVSVEPIPVAVTGVTIDETLAVNIGQSKTPSWTVNPAEATNKAVSFSSGNPAAATVNPTTGEVTGAAKGTATITITTADGSFTDTCVVTVSCAHASKTSHSAVAGTCQAGGNEAYSECDACGQLFNAQGNEIGEIPVTDKDSANHTGSTEWTKTAVTHKQTYKCCGAPVVAEEDHEWNGDNVCDECNYPCTHSGGTATCQAAPVCVHCGMTYGNKDASNHVGGTTIINADPADHKTQHDGYTGDTQCLGCQQITAYGQAIPAGAHTPANGWTTDGTHHWKECSVANCGTVIGSKEEHSSTGANVATCEAKAVCDDCGVSYGAKLNHSYTDADQKAEALKTAGNCRDEAVYWYSCSACGKVENNDNHTFEGAKAPSIHVGGTTIINADPADHKTQHDGYTGDTQCLGCLQIVEYGQAIPSGAHVPANAWTTDGTHHWKECSVANCGTVIGVKEAHSSTGANVATCQKAAVCDTCAASYGSKADHDWDTSAWEKDASGHWYGCKTSGCTEKHQFSAHTPDHQGGATEEYPIKCTECFYLMEEQLQHTHVYNQQVVAPEFKATDADCQNQATYYYTCTCTEKGSQTFPSGPVGDHKPAADWTTDGTHHWKVCSVNGCGIEINGSKAVHSSTGANVATCQKAAVCDTCAASYGNKADHDWNTTEWAKDASGHWYACKTVGCTEKKDFAAHTPGPEATTSSPQLCTVCQYVIKPVVSVGGGGYYVPTVQKPIIEAGEGVKVTLSSDGKTATIEALEGYELDSVKLNDAEKGAVTEVKGLKTGDKLVVTAKKIVTEPDYTAIIDSLADYQLVARSKVVTMKDGKKAVKIVWYDEEGLEMDFDGVEIFRSAKRYKGYGTKPFFETEKDAYYNTQIEKGSKYFYKVRGYMEIEGEKYYTQWSQKAWRTVK